MCGEISKDQALQIMKYLECDMKIVNNVSTIEPTKLPPNRQIKKIVSNL